MTVILALPLLVIGAMAVYVVNADYAVLRARQGEVATSTLHGVAALTRSVVERAGHDGIQQLRPYVDQTERLRSHILSGEIAFATIYRGNRRLHPPEDPVNQLMSEIQQLRKVESIFSATRAFLTNAPTAWNLLQRPEESAIVHCRRESDTDVCILLEIDRIGSLLANELDEAYASLNGWWLAIRGPAGHRLWSTGEGPIESETEVLPLSGPLQGWHVEASPDPAAAIASPSALTLTAIVLPLLACWLALTWYFLRSQRTKLADSRHRAEIASHLSHELRTPLTNLKLYAGLLQRRAGDADTVREYSAVIDSETDRLSRLAENATAFARGEVSDTASYATAIPDATAMAVIERLRSLCDDAGCSIRFHGAAPNSCRFDTAAFEQILVNLLDNARKYAAGTSIEVATRIDQSLEHDMLELTVRDHGPGIPAHLGQQIFDLMARGSSGASGFGLGLAVVRRLARLNGGDALARNAEPGAAFSVSIQLESPLRNGET